MFSVTSNQIMTGVFSMIRMQRQVKIKLHIDKIGMGDDFVCGIRQLSEYTKKLSKNTCICAPSGVDKLSFRLSRK
ncbi:MAG: hypothetical protein CSB34_00685 [Desulfobulbus propionicus]|nr:MAG: hypothetical protein CSB34_00685 [Desulfobulbus propionicus]